MSQQPSSDAKRIAAGLSQLVSRIASFGGRSSAPALGGVDPGVRSTSPPSLPPVYTDVTDITALRAVMLGIRSSIQPYIDRLVRYSPTGFWNPLELYPDEATGRLKSIPLPYTETEDGIIYALEFVADGPAGAGLYAPGPNGTLKLVMTEAEFAEYRELLRRYEDLATYIEVNFGSGILDDELESIEQRWRMSPEYAEYQRQLAETERAMDVMDMAMQAAMAEQSSWFNGITQGRLAAEVRRADMDSLGFSMAPYVSPASPISPSLEQRTMYWYNKLLSELPAIPVAPTPPGIGSMGSSKTPFLPDWLNHGKPESRHTMPTPHFDFPPEDNQLYDLLPDGTEVPMMGTRSKSAATVTALRTRAPEIPAFALRAIKDYPRELDEPLTTYSAYGYNNPHLLTQLMRDALDRARRRGYDR